jgi:uncharacterized protein YndB with AHSA1/START domain
MVLKMPDGSEHPFHGTYVEIVEPKRVVYTECYEMPQFGNPQWLTTVSFEETGTGTLVTHTVRHETQEARDGHLQAGMEGGERQARARLDAYLAGQV